MKDHRIMFIQRIVTSTFILCHACSYANQVTVRIGQDAVLPCNFKVTDGTGIRSISWTKDGTQKIFHDRDAFDGGEKYNVTVDESCCSLLTIFGVNGEDAGNYSCTYFSPYSQREIFILEAIDGSIGTNRNNLREKEIATFWCIVHGTNKRNTIGWMLGDRNITENSTQLFTANAVNSTVQIHLTWKTNKQSLFCVFKSHVISRVALDVKYWPRILQTNVRKLVEEVGAFNISCVVSANPEVPGMVSWEKKYFHQWKYVSTSALQYKITGYVSAWNLMTTSTVMIQKYRCKAFNGIGKAVNSHEITVYVKDLMMCNTKRTFLEQHQTFVKCSFTKEMTTSVAIRWYLDDKHDLTDNSTQDLAPSFDDKTTLQSTLIFYPSRQDNFRNLTCKAGDSFNLMDTILLNITYCPEGVKFDCTVVNSRNSLNLFKARCESGLSNPAAKLILKLGDTNLTSHLPPERKFTQREGIDGFTTTITYQQSIHVEIRDFACCAELPMCEPVCSMTQCNTTTLADNQYSKILSIVLGAILLVAIVFCVCCFVYCSHDKTAYVSSPMTRVDTFPMRYIQNGTDQNQEAAYESVDDRINERVSRGSYVEARCSALPAIPTDSIVVDRFEDMNADTFEESVFKKDSNSNYQDASVYSGVSAGPYLPMRSRIYSLTLEPFVEG